MNSRAARSATVHRAVGKGESVDADGLNVVAAAVEGAGTEALGGGPSAGGCGLAAGIDDLEVDGRRGAVGGEGQKEGGGGLLRLIVLSSEINGEGESVRAGGVRGEVAIFDGEDAPQSAAIVEFGVPDGWEELAVGWAVGDVDDKFEGRLVPDPGAEFVFGRAFAIATGVAGEEGSVCACIKEGEGKDLGVLESFEIESDADDVGLVV